MKGDASMTAFEDGLKKDQDASNFGNDLIEDIDITGDPYYLKYYRSFHNHELDPNTILNEGALLDEDIVRSGALTLLP
jgi:hypothetical protein